MHVGSIATPIVFIKSNFIAFKNCLDFFKELHYYVEEHFRNKFNGICVYRKVQINGRGEIRPKYRHNKICIIKIIICNTNFLINNENSNMVFTKSLRLSFR